MNIITKISESVVSLFGNSQLAPETMKNPTRIDNLPLMRKYLGKYLVHEKCIQGHSVLTSASTKKSADTHVLFFHGGAYIWPGDFPHWNFIKRILRATPCRISYIDYPLAPEYNYKDTFNMVQASLDHLLSVYPDDDYLLMGDSAGGGLALALAQKLQDEGSRLQPKKIILLSPWLDLLLDNPKIQEVEEHDQILNMEGLLAAGDLYAAGETKENPLLSPLRGNLSGLAPISLYIGTHDILWPDTLLLKDKIEEVGGKISFHEYSEMMHDWVLFPMPESRSVIRKIIKEISN